jgi:hypothetical protein
MLPNAKFDRLGPRFRNNFLWRAEVGRAPPFIPPPPCIEGTPSTLVLVSQDRMFAPLCWLSVFFVCRFAVCGLCVWPVCGLCVFVCVGDGRWT